jgi:aminodeoxyfutalosine synthase
MNLKIPDITKKESEIFSKVLNKKRISIDDALHLYQNTNLALVAMMAHNVRINLHRRQVFFNRNIHLELTNICQNKCIFCSFYRKDNDSDAWDMSINQAIEYIISKDPKKLSEVHLTGGLHPEKNLDFYKELFCKITRLYPNIHIKALTAVEIHYISQLENKSYKTIISELHEAGLNSLAGGGAEILDDNIREKICPEKINSQIWLEIHKTAHRLNIQSNCTMLYGHIETYEDRIIHMEKLRNLQDETAGFNCFIPLKYKSAANNLDIKEEISLIEELKNYAVSRIFMDNIPHLKAYWPMCGKDTAFLSLNFGVDDIDGTINDTTKIYAMAGSNEKNPEMSISEMQDRCEAAGFNLKERDSLYNIIP